MRGCFIVLYFEAYFVYSPVPVECSIGSAMEQERMFCVVRSRSGHMTPTAVSEPTTNALDWSKQLLLAWTVV